MSAMRILVLSMLLTMGTQLRASDDRACPECGCCGRKVTCRLVCEETEIKEDRWKCECEDYCIPGPSHSCGEQCECDNSKRSGFWCIKLWHPSPHAQLRTRKKLIKDEATRTVRSHQWVTEEVCSECGCRLGNHSNTPQDSAAPAADAGNAVSEGDQPIFVNRRLRKTLKRISSKGQE